jgi:hypothetical protein
MVVIIVGLERSGTAYVTQCIHRSGIPMILYGPQTGGWEDHKIQQINRSGHSSSFVTGLKTYKKECEQKHGINYGFKEPWIIYHMKPYLTIWSDAKYIVCVRNPISAANSIVHKLGLGYSLYTALGRYNSHLARITEKMYIFNYDGDISTEQKKLSTFLDRPIDLASGWKRDYINKLGEYK